MARVLIAWLCLCSYAPAALAIPGNTPITNTAEVSYSVNALQFNVSGSVTVITDPTAGNSPPLAVSLAPPAVPENSAGAVVGTLTVTDLDPGDAHTVAVSDPRFTVAGLTLMLAPGQALDFETEPQVPLSLTVTDSQGGVLNQLLTVLVSNVNEAPDGLTLSDASLDAGVNGAPVGDLSVTDVDAGDTHTYSVDDPRFTVTGNTLQLAAAESLPLGTTVTVMVTATDSGGLSVTRPFDITAVPPGSGTGTGAGISVLQYAPLAADAQDFALAATRCDAGAGLQPLPPPLSLVGGTLAVPGLLPLRVTAVLKAADVLFVQVSDADANTDPLLADSLTVSLSSDTGDSESIVLTEAGADTGVFVGYIQSALPPSAAADCVLAVQRGGVVTAGYVDAADPVDSVSLEVLVDPFSRVFDSASGRPVNGALVSLVQASDASPAAVFADDGLTPHAASQHSGDAQAGLAPGAYRFPFVNAGNYVLQVIPPNRFAFPSGVPDSQLQTLPGNPFSLGGARGQPFNLPAGPAMWVDIPLDVVPVAPTASSVELFAVAPAGADAGVVQASRCYDGSQFVPAADPVSLVQGGLTVPASIPLAAAGRLARGDVLFIRVTDGDQDLDPFAADELEVTVTVPGQADSERVLLLETNDSTGVFTGYLQTRAADAAVPFNCALEAPMGTAAQVSYADALDANDSASAQVLLDPGFTVFSSLNGALLDGVNVTLIDNSSGLPARVLGVDGNATFPATVESGAEVTDSSGRRYDFAPGTFHFPVVAPGEYVLQVNSGAYRFPSVVDDASLAGLGSFELQAGSRGQPFTVTAGVPVSFDLPLDPLAADVFVSKQVNKEVAAVGDFVQYSVQVQNSPSAAPVTDLRLIDDLPQGFRYAEGSLRVAGTSGPLPEFSADGRRLQLDIGMLEAGETVEIRYVTEITAGTPLGNARNRALVQGSGIADANEAYADVLVQEDLFRSKAFISGRVTAGPCPGEADGDDARRGVADVRVWLENGSFVVTDQDGKYHFEGVEPGTHVVQLDGASLPDNYQPYGCENNTQFAGSSTSQFVDLQPGVLWRADFYVREKPEASAEVVTRLDAEAGEGRVHYRYHIVGGDVPLRKILATVMLDDKLAYLEGSTRLNGVAKPDPAGIEQGALSFRLPASAESFEYLLEFDTFVKNPKGEIEVKAVTQMSNAGGRYRSEVSSNRIGLNWPSSLITISQSLRSLPRVGYASSAANARALQRAQAENARALPARSASAGADIKVAGRVHEPTRGTQVTRSAASRTRVRDAAPRQDHQPYQLPPPDNGASPVFDRSWLRAHLAADGGGSGIVWPPQRYNPTMPAIAVAVVHPTGQRPELLVDGKLVSPLTFEGVTRDSGQQMSVTRWENVSISERDSIIEAQLLNREGNVVQSFQREVHFSGSPVRAELVPELSYLVADGVYPPVVAVRLFDRAGYPLRAGTTGEFTVSAPYAALDKTRHLENSKSLFANERYKVLRDGVAYIQLQPTVESGEVALGFHFDQLRQQQIRARLLPGARDWIMVGLAEGSYSRRSLSGSLRGLQESGLDDHHLSDGRVAFYAKGMVKGDWLLTAAYDTDKQFSRTLREQIDPNQFYTLYGDGATQMFDAQSQRKLYLKLEKHRFMSLFGDFDTEFQRSELTRYERRMNGMKMGYYGRHVELNAFASETNQGFVRDELQGNGTSGVYRLSSGGLVRNSENVRLVTRDRFSLDRIISETQLVRFLDYTIDFERGQLIFKQPVFSQDQDFNPVFIEVEYEVGGADGSGGDELVAGARAAYRLDNQDSELAVSVVDDSTPGQGGSLAGVDFTMQFNELQKLSVEYAKSRTDLGGDADAYLLELRHGGERLAGRAYVTEQEDGFGLGHQSSLELGTRRLGVEAEYRLRQHLLMRGQLAQQRLLSNGADRWVADMETQYQLPASRLSAGLRGVRESVANGESLEATQVLMGASRQLWGDRLLLRGDAELDVSAGGDNTDYPSRGIIGAEYEFINDVRLLLEQELTWGAARDTQDTRLGLRARPWTGADARSTVSRQRGENGERLFATTGLLQQWRLNRQWLVDVGFDRVQTLRRQGQVDSGALLFNPAQPPASGSLDGDFNQDFTALFSGFTYTRDAWNISSRVEFHDGDLSRRWNVLAGANHQLAEGRVVSSSLAWFNEEHADGRLQDSADLRLGLAWRPAGSRWTLLNRSDLVFTRLQDSLFDTRGRKWVNNLNANYKTAAEPGSRQHQVALQLGIKYLVEQIDGVEYDGVTLLYGAQYRYNFRPRWDAGVHGSVLHSLQADARDYSAGLSVGFNPYRDMWLSVGYNFFGFQDNDFIAAEYTARGPFLKLRLKFDQALAQKFLAFAGLDAEWQQQPANSR